MSQKTDLNISPYYDDFDESKKFHKILFRAGRPVQARELTQSQSLLQNQVQRFGDHMFKEGSIVNGAETDIDMDVEFVKLEATNPNTSGTTDVSSYIADFEGKIIQGETSGAIAKVITTVAQTSTDPDTLIVKYLQEGSDGSSTVQASVRFKSAEELREVTLSSSGAISVASNNNEFKVASDTTTANIVGRSSIANINEGVVFIRGFFVKVDAQTIVLEKYNGKPSFRIGLNVTESIETSSSDSSLLDNSQGTTNENAPGADRLKFTLTLTKFSLTDTTDTNFVELGRVNAGVIELEINRPIYGHIEQALARRTFDANGDFVVRQFTSSFREHLMDGFNRGFFESFQGGDESKVVMQISPGKAYIKGFEVTKDGTSNVEINKARTTEVLNNAQTPARIGNQLRVTNAHGLPEFGDSTSLTAYKEIKVYNSTLSAGTIPGTDSHIGFCRCRTIDNYDDNALNLYLFDIKMFTELTFSSGSGDFVRGDKVTASNGATGIVAYASTSKIMLHDVVGTFTTTVTLDVRGKGTHLDTDTTQPTAVRTYNMEDARGLGQNKSSTSEQDFTADVVIDNIVTIQGSSTFSGSALTGVNTQFLTDLKVGDIIIDGGGADRTITAIASNVAATLNTNSSADAVGVGLLRKRAKLYKQDQSASIFAFPRDHVATNESISYSVIRQADFAVSAQGTITLTKTDEESFTTFGNDNYQFSVVAEKTSGSPTVTNGELLLPEDNSHSDNPSGNLTNSVSGNNNVITLAGTSGQDTGAIIRAS